MKQTSHTLTMVYDIADDFHIEIEQTTFDDTPLKLTFMSDEVSKYKDAIYYLFNDTDEMLQVMDSIKDCIIDFRKKFDKLKEDE